MDDTAFADNSNGTPKDSVTVSPVEVESKRASAVSWIPLDREPRIVTSSTWSLVPVPYPPNTRRHASDDTPQSRMTTRVSELGSAPSESSSPLDRKSTRLNSSHRCISYAVFCLKKNKTET